MGGPSWLQRDPFRHLPESAKRQLSRAAELRHCPQRSVLFREGDPADSLWVIQRGWVQLVKRTADGKTLTLDFVTPRDRICGLSAFNKQGYLASAIATTPVVALRIPAPVVGRLLKEQARFAACVAGIFGQRFHHMAAAYATAFAPVEHRIASVLLRLREDFGRSIPVTRRELGELSGTTVETAIRVTRQMQRDGVLQMSRGRILLLRPEALKRKIRP